VVSYSTSRGQNLIKRVSFLKCFNTDHLPGEKLRYCHYVIVFESWKRIKTSLSPLCFRISEFIQNVFSSFWKNCHPLFVILWLDVEYMFSNIILKWVFLCSAFINDALPFFSPLICSKSEWFLVMIEKSGKTN